MNKNLKSLLIKLGLILSALLISINVTTYLIDIDIILNPIYGISLIFINILFGICAFLYSKKEFPNEPNSFKNVFSSFLTPIIIGVALNSLFVFTYFNFVNKSDAEYIQEKTISSFQEVIDSKDIQLNKLINDNNISEEKAEKIENQINQSKEELKRLKKSNQFNIVTTLKATLRFIIVYSIIGVLVGVAFKRKTVK